MCPGSCLTTALWPRWIICPGFQKIRSRHAGPWTSETGTIFGVPFIAVSHGIYYNADIFKNLNIQVPDTWEAFIGICRTLKNLGHVPLANASGDAWTINEIVFFNLAPNFIGGRDGRMAYLTGDRCFNDSHMVSALTAVRDLAPFLPDDQSLLRYMDSLQLFVQAKAVMWMGGSWDIPYFNSESPDFGWDVFRYRHRRDSLLTSRFIWMPALGSIRIPLTNKPHKHLWNGSFSRNSAGFWAITCPDFFPCTAPIQN